MITHIFIKNHTFVQKVLTKTQFWHQSRAITLKLDDEIYLFTIPKHTFPISTLMQILKKINQILAKIESKNEFLTSIKGHNSSLNWRNLPIYNPKPLLPNIKSYTKFKENRSLKKIDQKMLKIESWNKGWRTDGRTDTQT